MEKCEIINMAFQTYPDQVRKETTEHMAETLVYERVGTYLRRQLINLYQQEETAFVKKCIELLALFKKDIMKFNQLFNSNLLPNMKPNKSVKIFKLLLTKCQIPYEMMFIMLKSMIMATEELG